MLSIANHSHRRQGIMVVWLVLALAAIIGVVAIGLDGGRLLSERQHVQASADASALAAANSLFKGNSAGAATNAAIQMAASNGIANDGTNSVVTVNIPPLQGDFAGKAGYTEVIVSNRLNAAFSLIFGYNGLTVTARAVARGVMTGEVKGVYALQSSGADGVHVHDKGSINVVNAPVYVNSTDKSALHVDNGGTITSTAFNVVGGANAPKGLNGPLNTGIPPVQDPLAAVPPPDPTGVPVQSGNTLTVSTTLTISPGIYVGGINVKAGGNLTMQPGVYIIQGGGFVVGGGGIVNGTGVMIYNGGKPPTGTANSININPGAKGSVTLRPPTSGVYAGISFFQDRKSNATVQITASNNIMITGAIYAPVAPMTLTGPNPPATGTMDILGGVVIGLKEDLQGQFNIDNSTDPRPAMSLFGLVD